MSTGIVYQATNKATKKIYVGQSVESLSMRKCKHRNEAEHGNDSYFGRALRKYGLAGFTWKVLCNVDAPTKQLVKTYLDLMEIQHIEQLHTLDRSVGYNSTAGGGGSVGFKHKKSSRKKMSEAHTGLKNPNYPKHPKPKPPMSEETKEKCRRAKLGSKNPMYGKHPSEESLRKKSESSKGIIHSKEWSKNQSEGMKRAWARKKVMTAEERRERKRESQRQWRLRQK